MAELGEIFRGVAVLDMAPAEIQEDLAAVAYPTVTSWLHYNLNPMGQVLWQVKPPGSWVVIRRYGNSLVSTSANIPLEVDYAEVYRMLREERATLYAKTSDLGLVAVAVQKEGQPVTALAPGFFATTLVDPRMLGPGGIESLSEHGYDWPEGLLKPSIIQLKAPFDILSLDSELATARRKEYLEQAPEGIWLTTTVGDTFHIFELLG